MNRKTVYQILMRTLFMLICVAFSHSLLAQQRVVSGSVRDINGAGLPGVSILVKGTTVGTITDAQGRYSISAGSDATLQFSFIGYLTQEVAVSNRPVIDMILEEDIQQLGEVVVTALGIERSQKALQSSITKVPGVGLTTARENSLGNAMQGRVAGVNISRSQTGVAGSSRVIIRGNKSLGGSNQPLYVIDGVPMDNTQFGQVGLWGGTDQGDGLTSLNPDDIESVTVLKGAAAAALYGSRGGFGVINITTKRGTQRKGIGMEFNSNYVFEKVYRLDDLQEEYGPGGLKIDPANLSGPRIFSKPASQLEAWNWGNGSMWGQKYDGSMVYQFDGVQRPYSFAGDNWERFYKTGTSWTNSFAVTGGGENQTFRFSFSDLKDTYIIPLQGFNRKNLSLTTNGKFGKRFTFNAKVMYSNEKTKNRSLLNDSPANVPYAIWGLARNVNVMDLYGDPNKPGAIPAGVITPDLKKPGEEYSQASSQFTQNPWWAAYQMTNQNIRERFITSGELRYNIFDWLYVQGRIGMDYYTRNSNVLVPMGTGYLRKGSKDHTTSFVKELNLEGIIGADKTFGNINVNAFAGANKMTHESETMDVLGQVFNIPFFPSITNTNQKNIFYGYSKTGINSLFGSLEIGYKRFLYLTATGRSDWFSVLNPVSNHKFYPSIGGSFVFTDAIKSLPAFLSYGKLRAAWGQVATANVGAYSIQPTYMLYGGGHLGLPMGIYSFGDLIPNSNLKPALSSEIEFGTDLKLFGGRAGIEFTYYTQKTTNDILAATVSQTTGFNSTSINIGELTNKGYEILLSGTPVQGSVTWDLSLNIAHNKNKVVELAPGIDRVFIDEPRTRAAGVYHLKGYPYGMILGFVQKTDPATGKKVYDAQGRPVRSDVYEILGNGVAKFTGGLSNTLTWKSFALDFLVDFKFGGDLYSGTEVNLTNWGLHKQTLAYREGGMPVEGVIQTGADSNGNPVYEPFSKALNQEETRNYWSYVTSYAQERFIYDASFIKLRQIQLEYRLPQKLLTKTPFTSGSISIVGRNLWIIYRNTDNIDPESTYTSGSAQGVEQFAMPTTRAYGFNLRVTF